MFDYSEGDSQSTIVPAAASALSVYLSIYLSIFFPAAAENEQGRSCPLTKLYVDMTHAICCM